MCQTKEGIKIMTGKLPEVIVFKTYAKYSKIIGSIINQITKENKISVRSVKLLLRMNNA